MTIDESLFSAILGRFKSLGLLKVRGRQRADSTHVPATGRMLKPSGTGGRNAPIHPQCTRQTRPGVAQGKVDGEWFVRYGDRFENQRLPTEKQEREQLAKTVGADDYALLTAIHDRLAPAGLRDVEAVQSLQAKSKMSRINFTSPFVLNPKHRSLVQQKDDYSELYQETKTMNPLVI